MKRLFTSESVTEGHPDKVCDQISDAVLDAILAQDPMARVACECASCTGLVMVMGEITTSCYVNIDGIARDALRRIGYNRAKYGFDADSCAVLTSLHGQSPDIAQGVDSALETRNSAVLDIGAGDQGMMFGYACDETPEYMPAAIALAHRVTKNLAQVRKSGELSYLRPDGKAQITVEYDGDTPRRIDTVVVSTQHSPDVDMAQLHKDVIERVVRPVIPDGLLDDDTRYLINPTGRFVLGGPAGDSGLTGRKIIVDTYGGYAHHGGGAFSGKDPTKVDRSAAYALRHVAKNLVAAGVAKRVEVGVAYAIGVAHPVSITVDASGSALSNEQIADLVARTFDLRPAAIIERLGLRRPIYAQTASYGHFGRDDLDLPWEKLDCVDAIRAKM